MIRTANSLFFINTTKVSDFLAFALIAIRWQSQVDDATEAPQFFCTTESVVYCRSSDPQLIDRAKRFGTIRIPLSHWTEESYLTIGQRKFFYRTRTTSNAIHFHNSPIHRFATTPDNWAIVNNWPMTFRYNVLQCTARMIYRFSK